MNGEKRCWCGNRDSPWKGGKKQEQDERDGYRHLVERTYEAFPRTVRLPAPVAADRIKAASTRMGYSR
jgi:hypothetical protein